MSSWLASSPQSSSSISPFCVEFPQACVGSASSPGSPQDGFGASPGSAQSSYSGASCVSDDQCAGSRCRDGKCAALCGNGAIDAGEECDLGDENSDLLPDRCRTDCRNPRCGDGVVDSDEQCDDGNGVSDDGCDGLCRAEARRITIDLPLTPLTAETTGGIGRGRAPVGQTGPGAVAAMAAGAAAGWAWIRRKRRK